MGAQVGALVLDSFYDAFEQQNMFLCENISNIVVSPDVATDDGTGGWGGWSPYLLLDTRELEAASQLCTSMHEAIVSSRPCSSRGGHRRAVRERVRGRAGLSFEM